MTLTIKLSSETERRLVRAASESGLAPDAFAQRLIEQGLDENRSSNAPEGDLLGEILAPFRKEVKESGLSDDDLRDLFTEVRDEIRAEKRAKRTQGPAAE